MIVDSIYDIDLRVLKDQGIHVLLLDLDGTLANNDIKIPDVRLLEWFEHIKQEGFKFLIASNNREIRVKTFCESLKISYVSQMFKPFKFKLKLLLKKIEEEVTQQSSEIKFEEIAIIGDQIFTDILIGNRIKIYTILVKNPIMVTNPFRWLVTKLQNFVLMSYEKSKKVKNRLSQH